MSHRGILYSYIGICKTGLNFSDYFVHQTIGQVCVLVSKVITPHQDHVISLVCIGLDVCMLDHLIREEGDVTG